MNGVHAIAMDLRNLGASTLTIRLEFENPFAGGDAAKTNAGFTLPAGGDWKVAVLPERERGRIGRPRGM